MAKDVKVYTTPTCPWCKKVKAFLNDNKISFKEIDASSEAGAKELMEKSGQMGVPVVDIDGKVIVGSDEEKLKGALGI